MRLIGNKTRLLGAIEGLLRERGIGGGTLIDIFSGTSSVGRRFKALGFRVIANDQLSAGYTQAVAGVEVSRYPRFRKLLKGQAPLVGSPKFRSSFAGGEIDLSVLPHVGPRDPSLPLRQAVHLLDSFVPPREGLVFRNYCPGGPRGAMFFRDDHGRKIDGILEFLREAHRQGSLERGELHLLLASLIDAADRVANISGTYGAYLKRWQSNTRGGLRLEPPGVVESPFRNEAHREDSNRLIRRLSGDVLYIDPPYNHRQYAANYHLLEILAEHHRVDDLAAYEAALYGKTGLRPYRDLVSLYCVRPGSRGAAGGDALSAMADLVLNARVKAVVVSYNEEGILRREEIGSILARFSGARSFDFDRDLWTLDFPRFRSDTDRPAEGSRAGRAYRVVEGREPGRVGELLFFASRAGAGTLRGRRPAFPRTTRGRLPRAAGGCLDP